MDGRTAAAPELVEVLLGAAGQTGPWTVEAVAEVGWLNTNTTIRTAGGERLVVRTYRWPFEGRPRYDRASKEAWLHPLLAAAGVPVAEVLAIGEADGARGALLAWLPGEALGVVAQRVGPDRLAEAWREAGAALAAAHRVPVRVETAGFLAAAGEVHPMPDGTFGGFHERRITEHARQAAAQQPGIGLDPAQVIDLVRRARPAMEAVPLTLGHGDAHPWNVLVHEVGGRWRLSGWLDWEMAWVGDPAWDHMRMTVQRFAEIGPTPDAWFEGYGGRPPALNLAVAVLNFMLWKAVDADDTRDRAVALTWLADLSAHLAAIADLLG